MSLQNMNFNCLSWSSQWVSMQIALSALNNKLHVCFLCYRVSKSLLKARSAMRVGEACEQNCLFDYELFTEMDAVGLSDSMRKYL